MSVKSREEKREAARVAADLRVRSTSAGELLELNVVNLSVGGAYCGSPRAIEPMTRLEVIFDLPGSGAVSIPVAAQAVVVRMDRAARRTAPHPFLLALWFQRMTDHDRARLRRFLGQDGN